MRICLKVDVDTYRGMREGLARMLEMFRARRIPATVFVSMGPDHSGRAIRRIFTKRGFLKKMLRTKAVALYGPRTVLYGTLLPGPRIAEGNRELFRRIEGEGHEAGVHGWDHVRWQDGLPRFDEETIARELRQAFEVFESVAGHAPRATAAPGWIVTAASLAVQDRLGLLYSSDVRGTDPFLPRIGGRTFSTLQIPTTLPTLDELMGAREEGARGGAAPRAPVPREIRSDTAALPAARADVRGPRHEQSRDSSEGSPGESGRATQGVPPGEALGGESWINDLLMAEVRRQASVDSKRPIVHTIHTEVEGLSRAELFADLLDRLLAEGARFERLDAVAAGLLPSAASASAASPPEGAGSPAAGPESARPPGRGVPASRGSVSVCEVRDGVLPGRSGTLAVQEAPHTRT